MFKPIKIAHEEGSKLFFVSDTHFSHDKEFLYGKRGYNSVEEHDAGLIKTWNERVRPCDKVIHLGDFILGAGRDAKELAYHLLEKLNGKIYLIWGNHNSGVKQVYEDTLQIFGLASNLEVYPLTRDKYTFLGNQALLKVKAENKTHFVFCSHFAHRIWIDYNRNVWHVSGHSHGNDSETLPDCKNGKKLDVGIEVFGGPIVFDEVAKIMNQKQFVELDHHDSSTRPSF